LKKDAGLRSITWRNAFTFPKVSISALRTPLIKSLSEK